LKASFEIFRYRPGEKERFDTFQIELSSHATVLDALKLIQETVDPSLIYRHSCHHGSCGTCSCIINGVERLACLTKVTELSEAVVRVEPLRRMPRIGDIAVDPSPLFLEIDPRWSYLRQSETSRLSAVKAGSVQSHDPNADHVSARYISLERVRFESCIECGSCVSACPVGEDFMGPAVLALLNRERIKRPEQAPILLKRAGGNTGVSRCERALNCSRVCPTGVNPARHIMDLRRALGRNTK